MAIFNKSFILLSILFLKQSDAFVPTFRSVSVSAQWGIASTNTAMTTTTLMAKKKRRKRKADEPASEPDFDDDSDLDSNELPDFDLDGPPVDKSASPRPKAAKSSITGEAPITSAQMGSVKPLSSINELLNDRSLEQELSFDLPVKDAEELPNFSDYIKSSKLDEPIGKKAARNEARRLAAIDAEEAEEEGFFANLPFIGGGDKDDDEEKEPLNPLKVCSGDVCFDILLSHDFLTFLNPPLATSFLKMELGLGFIH